ncbi:MAG: hypothetical protein P8J33_09275 [Pirellulaceae bacterium]|nr:hypothetical protein [Pirellulaceae bacterium]
MRNSSLSFLGLAALFITGCGLDHSGIYEAEMQVISGKQETEEHPFAEARKTWARFGIPVLELKPGGRFAKTENRHHTEGDWWVTADGTIAIHGDTHNGQSIHPGLRQEIDMQYNIRSNEILSRPYGEPESNLEIVWTKK